MISTALPWGGPASPFLAWRSHTKARAEATRLDEEIAQAALKLGFPAPAHGSPPIQPVIISAVFVAVTVLIALGAMAIELAVR